MKEFTDDEKIIARNIDKEYKWMARDKSGVLYIYCDKPTKSIGGDEWFINGFWAHLFGFEDLFKSVTWDDEEPTLIKDIYDPQILDDAERKYLTAVFKPFHQNIRYVKKLKYNGDRVEFIKAVVKDGGMTLPDFNAGEMYIGMEPDKAYSLADLGITYD